VLQDRHFGDTTATCFYIGLAPEAGAMLKVTIMQADSAETWELEGKLSGDWVKELERCWKERPPLAGASLQVHLKAVSYIDTAGKQLLTQMHERGVEIRGCGCMTKALIEEITRQESAN
jgi:ABC-type transporter Mla MlaB component